MTKHRLADGAGAVQQTVAEVYRVTHSGTLAGGYQRQRDSLYDGECLLPAPQTVAWATVPLEGQEFLRFAACDSIEDVADFVRAFGNSGLWGTFKRISPALPSVGSVKLPLVAALCPQVGLRMRAPGAPTFLEEPLEDLLRQAHLMRTLVDAYTLTQEPRAIGARIRRWRRIVLPQSALTLDAVGESFIDSLSAAGVRLAIVAGQLLVGPPLWPTGGLLIEVDPPGARSINLSREGLLAFVASVLDPMLSVIVGGTVATDGRLVLTRRIPFRPALLPILYAQAAETFATGGSIHECRWTGCKGAPAVPHLFLFKTRLTGERDGDRWRWKKQGSLTRERRRGDDYCSPECASAASSAAARGRKRSDLEQWRRRESRERRKR